MQSSCFHREIKSLDRFPFSTTQLPAWRLISPLDQRGGRRSVHADALGCIRLIAAPRNIWQRSSVFLSLPSSLPPFLIFSLILFLLLLRSLALRPVYEVSIVSIAHACLSFSIDTYVYAYTLSMRDARVPEARTGIITRHSDGDAIAGISAKVVAISRARVNRYCVRYAHTADWSRPNLHVCGPESRIIDLVNCASCARCHRVINISLEPKKETRDPSAWLATFKQLIAN